MDIKIEVITVPVTDVDASKAFYVDKLGFNADIDTTVNPELRFVQLTPPGSACSVVFGLGLTDMPPGSQRGIMAVIDDADETRQHLLEKGVDVTEVDEQDWGRFVYFADPDGNAWTLQQLPDRSGEAPA
jgi:catechol 2,3-dioxygenase-like lactoylglutathione lyase family enzyme